LKRLIEDFGLLVEKKRAAHSETHPSILLTKNDKSRGARIYFLKKGEELKEADGALLDWNE